MPVATKRNCSPLCNLFYGFLIYALIYYHGAFAADLFHGTILAITRDDNTVAVAADTMVTDENGQQTDQRECKIIPLGTNSFFAVSGTARAFDINAKIVAQEQYLSSLPLRTVAENWRAAMISKYYGLPQAQMQAMIAGLTRIDINNRTVISGFFGGSGYAVSALINFRETPTGISFYDAPLEEVPHYGPRYGYTVAGTNSSKFRVAELLQGESEDAKAWHTLVNTEMSNFGYTGSIGNAFHIKKCLGYYY